MTKVLAKSAQRIQECLKAAQMDCRVLELPHTTRTATDAAQAIGCTISQIVKSLIFKTRDTHKPVLILVSGSNKVDLEVIEKEVGEPITKADAEFTRMITGFAIGGIPPIGHDCPIELIFLDQDLLCFDEIWAAAGTQNAVFCLKSQFLEELTQGKVMSISSPSV